MIVGAFAPPGPAIVTRPPCAVTTSRSVWTFMRADRDLEDALLGGTLAEALPRRVASRSGRERDAHLRLAAKHVQVQDGARERLRELEYQHEALAGLATDLDRSVTPFDLITLSCDAAVAFGEPLEMPLHGSDGGEVARRVVGLHAPGVRPGRHVLVHV